MMRRITFSGASDDLIHVDGFGPTYEEINIFNDSPYLGCFCIRAGEDEVDVHVLYGDTWAFAVTSRMTDTIPWPVRRQYGNLCPYSETLILEVPDDAELVKTPSRPRH